MEGAHLKPSFVSRAAFLATALAVTSAAGEPRCGTCHAMRLRRDSLRAGAHAKVTACAECHEPHGQALRRLGLGASQGLRHLYRQVGGGSTRIAIQGPGAAVVQANCVRCHPVELARVPPASPGPKPQPRTSAHAEAARNCLDCHRETAHARPAGGKDSQPQHIQIKDPS